MKYSLLSVATTGNTNIAAKLRIDSCIQIHLSVLTEDSAIISVVVANIYSKNVGGNNM